MTGRARPGDLLPPEHEALWRLGGVKLAVVYRYSPKRRAPLQPVRSVWCGLAQKIGQRWHVLRYEGRVPISEWTAWEWLLGAMGLPLLAVERVPRREGEPAKLRRRGAW